MPGQGGISVAGNPDEILARGLQCGARGFPGRISVMPGLELHQFQGELKVPEGQHFIFKF